MPYRDKEKQKKAIKEAVKKHREGITSKVLQERVLQEEGITYPPIVHALIVPEKRRKLEKIYRVLHERNQDKEVYYGVSRISFDLVGEMLEVTV